MTHLAEPGQWIERFGRAELPVLGRTVAELERIKKDPDRVTTAHVSDVVMHDPLMTFKVLRYIQQHRHRSQLVDVTTIAHALMMLGMEPFLVHFCEQPTLEQRLQDDRIALEGALKVVSRARHASVYARDWAVMRHDIEIDEVTTAALLHDFAELLLWCCAPQLAVRTEELACAEDVTLEAAQQAVLGFPMIALQVELAQVWQLPELLCRLMDERHASTPRALNVSLAVAVAHHSALGWDNAALAQDFAAIGRLLGCGPVVARERVVRLALAAAADWDWYGVPPAAAFLPASEGTVQRPRSDDSR